MSEMQPPAGEALTSELLAQLGAISLEDALQRLSEAGLWNENGAVGLAQAALEQGEAAPERAGRWLALAAAVGDAISLSPVAAGRIAYAEARQRVQAGDLVEAEVALRHAQALWQTVHAEGWLARSDLGLTQVLVMQGRYVEAEAVIRRAIASLTSAAGTDPDSLPFLSRAQRNLATLLVYQEQHEAALVAYDAAENTLRQLQTQLGVDDQDSLAAEFAHVALNRASALTFLDRPDEAEAALSSAMHSFDLVGEPVNRARAQTNLGRLLLRMGRYAAALEAFDQAAAVLVGDLPGDFSGGEEVAPDMLRQADELLLEHALAYIALNLLPEAQRALDRAEMLFRRSHQPYELAQSLYTRGLLEINRRNYAAAANALAEAVQLYVELRNPYWLRRTQTAQAILAERTGDANAAWVQVAALLDEGDSSPGQSWDIGGQVEAWLLRFRLALGRADLPGARAATNQVEAYLGGPMPMGSSAQPILPHLWLRLLHAKGQTEQAAGDVEAARRYFSAALTLLEQQRSSLALEEVRTAFLEDKTIFYSDLVLSLLDAPSPNEDGVAAAFAVVERARSRALLERLLASVDPQPADTDPDRAVRGAALRRRLHWLYNQLLGESDSRRPAGEITRQVQTAEAAIQQLEWRAAPLSAQAEPVRLAGLQAALAEDQQALIYYHAGDEVLAFVVGSQRATVVRRLAYVDEVGHAQAELRFHLGRAELGPDYLARHGVRLTRRLNQALAHLYEQLIAPLRDHIVADRWLIVPYGGLHLLPFHALRHAGRYLVQDVDISYAPSASVAAHTLQAGQRGSLERFAGVAPLDASIPYAPREVEACARLFGAAQLHLDAHADRASLYAAAATADVLHLATHGLFRPDNSFFSALKLADGWIDVREIYRLPLAARLVVLSACESGAGEVRGGDEVIGLTRGFLGAGAASVVASLWNVHDESASGLMVEFYRTLLDRNEEGAGLATRSAQAMAAAQRHAIASGMHPYYWAPFVVVT